MAAADGNNFVRPRSIANIKDITIFHLCYGAILVLTAWASDKLPVTTKVLPVRVYNKIISKKKFCNDYVIYQGICGGEDNKLLLHLTCEHSLAVAATRGQFQASPLALVGITGSYCSGFNHGLSFAAVSHWHLTGRLVCSIFNRTTIGFILLSAVIDGNE